MGGFAIVKGLQCANASRMSVIEGPDCNFFHLACLMHVVQLCGILQQHVTESVVILSLFEELLALCSHVL